LKSFFLELNSPIKMQVLSQGEGSLCLQIITKINPETLAGEMPREWDTELVSIEIDVPDSRGGRTMGSQESPKRHKNFL
jgi:hypothetical protein